MSTTLCRLFGHKYVYWIYNAAACHSAAAFSIVCGFWPRYVCVENVASGDKMEWYEGMTDAHAVKTVAAGTRSIITSLGITDNTDGFTDNADGFTVGLTGEMRRP